MPYLETVQELLEAKEGEHVQFKEAKNRSLTLERRRGAAALWRTMAAVSWYLASPTRDPAAWSEAQLSTSRSVPAWV